MIRQDLPLAKPLFLPEPCTRMLQFVALDRETFSPTADKERRKKMCVLSPVSYWKLISFILFVVHHARAASRNATVILYEYIYMKNKNVKCPLNLLIIWIFPHFTGLTIKKFCTLALTKL